MAIFAVKKILLALVFVSVSLASCHKTEEEVITPNFKLQVQAMHHTWGVSGIMMYIKYNQSTFPGTDVKLYDDSARTDPNGTAIFEHLSYGDYYVYAYGYDFLFMDWVTGNAFVQLTKLNVSGGEMDTVLMVSE